MGPGGFLCRYMLLASPLGHADGCTDELVLLTFGAIPPDRVCSAARRWRLLLVWAVQVHAEHQDPVRLLSIQGHRVAAAGDDFVHPRLHLVHSGLGMLGVFLPHE